MRICVPTEIKNSEYRVALTPAGVHDLITAGHEVSVQSGAGAGSSMTDAEYADAGAILVLLEREERAIERGFGPDGGEMLVPTGPKAGSGESLDDYWQRRRGNDPDLWVVALDIADGQRFAAETILP